MALLPSNTPTTSLTTAWRTSFQTVGFTTAKRTSLPNGCLLITLSFFTIEGIWVMATQEIVSREGPIKRLHVKRFQDLHRLFLREHLRIFYQLYAPTPAQHGSIWQPLIVTRR